MSKVHEMKLVGIDFNIENTSVHPGLDYATLCRIHQKMKELKPPSPEYQLRRIRQDEAIVKQIMGWDDAKEDEELQDHPGTD